MIAASTAYDSDIAFCGTDIDNLPPLNEDAADGDQMYVPWWLYRE